MPHIIIAPCVFDMETVGVLKTFEGSKGSALRTHVESLSKPRLVILISKDIHLVF